jgi:hypothetical protein
MPASEPQPAAARAHPFPLNRDGRADRAKTHMLLIGLAVVLMVHCAGKLRDLLGEAEDDVARARQHGHKEGHRARRRY